MESGPRRTGPRRRAGRNRPGDPGAGPAPERARGGPGCELILSELATERALLEAVLRQMPAGVIIAEAPSGRVILSNEQAARIARHPALPGEVEARYFRHRFYHPDGRPYGGDEWPLLRALRTGEVISDEEIRFQRSDGTWGTLSASAAPVRDGQGRIVAGVLVFSDISEREQARQAQRESEARFRDLVEASSDFVWEVNPEGIFTYVSPRVRDILGYEPEEVVGRSILDLLPPEDRPRMEPIYRAIGEQARPLRSLENRNVRKDGRIAILESSGVPYFDRQGRLVGFRGLDRDITARKEAEAERERLLRQVEEVARVSRQRAAELSGVIDTIPDAVHVADAQGRITTTNRAALRAMRITDQQAPPRELAEFLRLFAPRRPDGRPLTVQDLPLARALKGEAVEADDEVVYDPQMQRDRYFRTNAAPIIDDEGRILGAVAVTREVTEQVELLRQRDEFVSVAAHELKTPVTVMKGYAQGLLRMAPDLPPPGRKMLESINRGADRINRIITDLLDISRLQLARPGVNLDRVDLTALVREVIDRLAPTTARHRIRLLRAEPAVVEGDRDRLEQVLANLLDNAIKYSPRGGDIDVTVDVGDGQAVVSVADHGVGIPRARQAHLFERFYRAHAGTPYDFGGMGVGLYISSQIVARHRGRMWFESQEGVGSTFHFSLPLWRERGRP
mgnify:CR=1 FL=1